MSPRYAKRLTTVLLVVAFVVLLFVYLSGGVDDESDAPPNPTVTVEPAPSAPAR
ncbi:hypothetical protein [Gordonia sp. (in: high G+C Gram-positive bacteria)]|uniref:hypothetical protein n=1 Tax=Gordonia sp. (in: high G+C Gram-positive bacteria) TaxID=84139 RepID=UPI0039E63ECE